MSQSGLLFVNDRDLYADFSFVVTDQLAGFPGMIGSASRDVQLSDGPEMQGAILDPRLIRRTPGKATVRGYLSTTTPALALAALDALRGLVMSGGEVAVRTGYATDRFCYAVCDSFDGSSYVGEDLNGRVSVAMSFVVKDGVALRLQPDGYALTTGRTPCPIGTAESYPVITVHGGGAALANPVITVRNAAGDVVQTMGFTVSLGANDELLVDCARGLYVTRLTVGVPSDAASTWSSGDVPVLRPYDGFPENGIYPSVELSSSAGVAQGDITYTRRWI